MARPRPLLLPVWPMAGPRLVVAGWTRARVGRWHLLSRPINLVICDARTDKTDTSDGGGADNTAADRAAGRRSHFGSNTIKTLQALDLELR